MQHILLPRGASLSHDDVVPYVSDEYYRGISFTSYPARKGFQNVIATASRTSFAVREIYNNRPTHELEKFLQTWLIFGLLQEFLGDRFHHHAFVRTPERDNVIDHLPSSVSTLTPSIGSAARQVLSTEGLNELLEERLSRFPGDIQEQERVFDHLRECMALAEKARHFPSGFHPTIAFSIVAVHESLASTFHHHLWGSPRQILGASLPSNQLPYWIERMHEQGWCRKEATTACAQVNSIASMIFFLSKLEKRAESKHHSSCKEKNYFATDPSPTKYNQHNSPSCGCDSVEVDKARLNDILTRGSLPLLDCQIDQISQKVQINLVESTGHTPYVAFSHVWTDGLGNPGQNALRMCQLRDLHGLAQRALNPKQNDVGRSTAPLFWLDTLCVPVETGDAKTNAMGRMAKTYEDATYVLVLDRTLRSYNFHDMNYFDAAMRIYTSPWMRRLWCLQEGALPQRYKVCVFFKDVGVPLDHLRYRLATSGEVARRAQNDIAIELGAFRDLRRSPEDSLLPTSMADIVSALQFRSVTEAQDEALCIGILASLKVALLEKATSDRVAKMWFQICRADKAPSGVIFWVGPKLQNEGYRWAPSTLLKMASPKMEESTEIPAKLILPRTEGSEEELASLIPYGLKVKFPGVRISCRPKSQAIASVYPIPQRNPFLKIRNSDSWLLLFEPPSWQQSNQTQQPGIHDFIQSQGSRCMVICSEQPRTSGPDTRGTFPGYLLATLTENSSDGLRVRSQRLVTLTKCNERVGRMYNEAFIIAREASQDPITNDLQRAYDADNQRGTFDREFWFRSSWARLHSRAQQAMQDPSFEAIVNDDLQNSATGGFKGFMKHILDFYVGFYGTVDEWLPETTTWCVN